MSSSHTPVMLAEVLALLAPSSGEQILDATLGRGGHARALLEAAAGGDGSSRLLAVDRDAAALEAVQRAWPETLSEATSFVQARFSELTEHALTLEWLPADVVIADLGVSSPQLDEAARGFAFQQPGPLDMRMDPSRGLTARELLVDLREPQIETILREFGEERYARRIARAIKQALAAQPESALQTTTELAELVRRAVPLKGKGHHQGKRKGGSAGPSSSSFSRIHPATRTFQALRIAVNDELAELEALLEAVPRLIKPGGRIGILSFHSLEDRRVKHAFRDLAATGAYEVLTKKPRTASEAERAANPRARSAKLRVLRRLKAVGEESC